MNKIKLIRLKRQLSQTTLAKLSKTSRSTVDRYEKGWVKKFEVLDRLAKALGVRVGDLS